MRDEDQAPLRARVLDAFKVAWGANKGGGGGYRGSVLLVQGIKRRQGRFGFWVGTIPWFWESGGASRVPLLSLGLVPRPVPMPGLVLGAAFLAANFFFHF